MGLFSFLSRKPKLFTGRILATADVRAALGVNGPRAMLGKAAYAEINSASVVGLAQATRDQLWRAGINRWQSNATCTLFAQKFVTLGGEQFYGDAFYDRGMLSAGVISPALGDIWFRPDGASTGHAIGFALTELGAQFIDPQVPDALRPMTDNELFATYQLRLP